jgi:hypothetical protein
MAEINVRMQVSPARALEFLTLLARDDGFRERLATNTESVLEEYNIWIDSSDQGGIRFSTSIPPKHVVEEALVNVKAANEFGADAAPEVDPPLGFWPFFLFLATGDH